MHKIKKPQKAKSISEKISDIFTPAPLLDPEIDLADETAAKVRDYSADENDDDNLHDFNKQLSDIRKKNAPLLADVDDKYKGAITSRQDMNFEQDYSDDDDDDDEQQYENSDSDDNDADTTGFSMRLKNFDSADGDDDDIAHDSDEIQSDDNESIASNDSGANVDDEEDNASNDEDEDDEDEESDFDGGDMFPNSNFEHNDEPSNGTTELPSTSSTTGDIQKGYSAQNQLKIWEKLLEMRIHTQKVVTKANSMPTLEKFQNLCTADQSFADLAQTTSENVTNLLEKLCEMQQLLVKQYPETKQLAAKRKSSTQADANEPSSSKCERLSNEIQKSFEQYTDYRDATITKWHDRTKVLTPGLKSSKTNPFNVVQSIRGILSNRQELIRKTQLHKGGYELFDQHAATADECTPAIVSKNIGDSATDNISSSTTNQQQSQEKTELYCSEIYDDTDFYHTQLRELIEFKANTSNNMGDMTKQFIELQKLRNKIKKVVDTRASKGRKIRYVVHNKMVNFMAQNNDHNSWTDEAKDELFSSVFGGKT